MHTAYQNLTSASLRPASIFENYFQPNALCRNGFWPRRLFWRCPILRRWPLQDAGSGTGLKGSVETWRIPMGWWGCTSAKDNWPCVVSMPLLATVFECKKRPEQRIGLVKVGSGGDRKTLPRSGSGALWGWLRLFVTLFFVRTTADS